MPSPAGAGSAVPQAPLALPGGRGCALRSLGRQPSIRFGLPSASLRPRPRKKSVFMDAPNRSFKKELFFCSVSSASALNRRDKCFCRAESRIFSPPPSSLGAQTSASLWLSSVASAPSLLPLKRKVFYAPPFHNSSEDVPLQRDSADFSPPSL